MPFLKPDRYFDRLSSIDIQQDLLGSGIDCVLLDMDNTVVSRKTHDVPQDIREWIESAKEAGIDVCLLSNNWHFSPYEWALELGLPVFAKACKPLPHAFMIVRDRMNARSANTVVIGDQVTTDVVGAHLLGMTAYLVRPLAEEDLKHMSVLRPLEQMMLGGMEPEQ